MYHEFQTKAQTFEQKQQNKAQQIQHNHSLVETYPIIQHTDVRLNTCKTEPFTNSTRDTNYAEFKKTIKFSHPVMDDFIPKSPEIYNYFYIEQTEIIGIPSSQTTPPLETI